MTKEDKFLFECIETYNTIQKYKFVINPKDNSITKELRNNPRFVNAWWGLCTY